MELPRLDIRSPTIALAYAQWLLAQTEGKAFWLVSSLKDVPFLPEDKSDTDRTELLAKARSQLLAKIATPTVAQTPEGYSVVQIAVKNRDLIRFNGVVTRTGGWTSTVTKLATDIPVVYILR